ncbi:unnamed protein product [Closterium sp. Yama58-4]|nr:unnamed protein product [Closterium sp. Yama58-4]
MAEQVYNPDHTMTAAEEEALVASGEDLAVDDLPEGMFHHLADPVDLPAAKKPCTASNASPAPNSSPSTSYGAGPALPAHAPASLAIAALTAPSLGLAPSQAATAPSPNCQAARATAYASVASGSNLAPALPASLFASPTPGGAPRNLRRARTDAAAPMLFPLRRRAVVNVLLPEAGLESHRSEIFAGINSQLCGFMFASGIVPSFEQTIGDPYRVARRVYGRLLFSWPSQEDAAAFRKLFPLTLKVSNSRPLLLKVFEDRFAAFTAAKAAGATTLSIRNVPLDFDPEDIRAYLLGSTDSDGAHWLANLTDFHRASDPYEDTYFTHLAGLPIATPDDPNFERIPSEIPLEENKPPMVLNFSSHACALCANNHRASDHEAFAARRRQRLTNRNVISVAQLQKTNAMLPHLPLASPPRSPRAPPSVSHFDISPPCCTTPPALPELQPSPILLCPIVASSPMSPLLCYLTFPLPYRSGPLVLPLLLSILTPLPPWHIIFPLLQSYSPHPRCSVSSLPHPPLPSQLCYFTISPPYLSGPLVLPLPLSTLTSPPPCYTTPPLFQQYSSHPRCSAPLLPPLPPLTTQLPGRHDHRCPIPPHHSTPASPPPRSQRAPMEFPPRNPISTPPYAHRLIPPCPPQRSDPCTPTSLPQPLTLPALASLYSPLFPTAPPPPPPHPLQPHPLGLTPPSLARILPLLAAQHSPFPSFSPPSPLPTNSPPMKPSSVCSPSPRLHSPQPPPPQPSAIPAPLVVGLLSHPAPLLASPPPSLNFLLHAGKILGNHAAPTTLSNDPGLIYIGLDEKVEPWTCALCDFTCGAALDSAMLHIQSELHASRVKATAHLPAAKEAYGPWRALTLQQKPSRSPFPIRNRKSTPLSFTRENPRPRRSPRGALSTILPALRTGLPLPTLTTTATLLPPAVHVDRTNGPYPQKGGFSLVENLRPITLMNADYKVLALCLANRLQPVLPQLIHPSQTAFIKHRKIGDTINDTLDIMDWATYSSAPLLALTVDFRKAYDLVDRPFLLHALSVLGLPTSFIHWVRLMHSNTCTRISVNNMLGPTFPVRTGVRQGCPLAPLLFVCVMEIFHRYTSLFLPGFALSHAQRRLMACYADDVTLFLTSDTELGLAVVLLGVFGSVSGEIPNWRKYSIIPFNIPPTDLVHAGSIPIRVPTQNASSEFALSAYTLAPPPGTRLSPAYKAPPSV